MLKSARAIGVGLRGGRRPGQAALAVVLGLLAGLLCGWNLTVCLVLAAAICLNVPTRLFAAATLAGGAMAALAADAIRSLGVALLEEAGLRRAVAALGDGPVTAMLGWDSYAVAGGAGLALGIGLPAAGLVAVIAAYRNRNSGHSLERWLRPYGVPAALGVAAAAVAAPWWFGPRWASDALLRQLTEYNSAEVSAADVRLSLWTGHFVLRDFRVADPDHLERDRLRIGRVAGQLSPGELIRGRLRVDKVSLEHVRADVARGQLAQAAEGPLVIDEMPPEMAPIDEPAPRGERQIEIDSYLHDWPVVRHDLAWLEWLATGVERLADTESDGAPDGGGRPAARSELGRRRPRVMIRRLSASDLAAGWGLGRKSLIELSDLTSDPRASKEPTQLRLVAPRLAAELSVQFDLQSGRRRHSIKCSAYDVNFAALMGASQPGRVALAAKGAGNLTGEGWLDRRRLELPLQIEMQPHELPIDGPGRFAGVEHELWRKSLSRLDRLQIDALLGGPWATPTLTVDADRLVEQLKHQLRASGAQDLVLAIDKQLAQPAENANAVMQASASERELGSPGVCQASDDAPLPGASQNGGPAEAGDLRPNVTALGSAEYPNTSAPDGRPAEGWAQQPPEPASPSPLHPGAGLQVAGRYSGQVRRPVLPGPVNLFVGLDPIDAVPEPAFDTAPPDAAEPPPAAGPNWPGDAPGESTDADDGPRTVVRQSFLARWSDALRDRFNRSSRVPEPEPIDDLTPPIAPPAFDAPPLGGPFEEPVMPATAGSRPWYKRLWR